MTPTTENMITVTKTAFDLDSKKEVKVQKEAPFTPVASMEEFTNRLNNNAALILQLANEALKVQAEKELEKDTTITWKLVDEDAEGKEILTDFTGTLISEEKSRGLNKAVIEFASLLFGYKKVMVPGNKEENIKAKNKAKDDARDMILSNPASIEKLKLAE